jgi:hypothetical protein
VVDAVVVKLSSGAHDAVGRPSQRPVYFCEADLAPQYGESGSLSEGVP